MNIYDLLPALPEIVLLTMICLVLVTDLFIKDDEKDITFWLSILTLAFTLWSIFSTYPETREVIFDGSYVSDSLSHLLKLFAVLIVAVVFFYSRDYLRHNNLMRGEYYLLGMFGLFGMMVMMSAYSMLTMYLGLETLSLSLYVLVAIDRDPTKSAEAAMKFFVLGAIASGILLFGISWVYGVTSTLQFNEISFAIQQNPGINGVPLWFGLVFIIVGLAFKFGAVPFHMWLPDVYQGARSSVTLYIASAPKLAALALILRVLSDSFGDLHEIWQTMILIIAVLSLVIGNIVAIAQNNIKRMLGYSAIAHVGFILAAIFTGTQHGYSAALFYTITYVIMALGAFGMLLLLSREGLDIEVISDFKGLNERNPWFALVMLFFMFGMIGVPPWVGFFAKLAVINSVLEIGYFSIAVLMVLMSVVGAFYYLRIIWYMYFEKAIDKSLLQVSLDMKVLLSFNGMAVLVLGIFPSWLLQICRNIIFV